MGLDFSHCDAHWSYSGFNRFRSRLAEVEGFVLTEMDGFRNGRRSWDDESTPLKPLLNHSDCGGVLTPEEISQILPRMKEIVANWPEGDHDKWRAEELIKGMELCVYRGEELEFT